MKTNKIINIVFFTVMYTILGELFVASIIMGLVATSSAAPANSDTTIIRAAEIVPMTPATDDDGIGIVLQEVYFIDGEPMLYGKHVDFDAETADFVRYLLNNPDAKWIEPILNEDGSIAEKIVDYLPFAAVAYDDGDRYWVELD